MAADSREIVRKARREGRSPGWMVGELQRQLGLSLIAANELVGFELHGGDEIDPATQRPTGQEIFDSLSPEKQDEVLGPAAAEMVRNGEATLADFVQRDGGFIRQKPVEALKAWREEDHPRGGDPKNPGRFSVGGGGKVPKWNHKQNYNGWVRKLSSSEQEALARQFYNKLWKQIEGYFGDIGQPPPELVFTTLPGDRIAQVWQNEQGIRQIQIRRSSFLLLALRGRHPLSLTAEAIVHEWRHIFQNADLYWIGRDQPYDDQPIEADAEAFGKKVARTMKQNRRRKRQGKPLIRPRPYNPQNIAENIGKDPTTIPYP